MAGSALPVYALPLHKHAFSPFLHSGLKHNGKDVPRQAEQANAWVVVNVSWVTLLEKGHNESLLPVLRYDALMPTSAMRMCSILRPPYLIISEDIPHTPAALLFLRALTAAAISGRVDLVRWRVMGNVLFLFLHPFAHRRLYRPMAIQELLEVLLWDVCLFLTQKRRD